MNRHSRRWRVALALAVLIAAPGVLGATAAGAPAAPYSTTPPVAISNGSPFGTCTADRYETQRLFSTNYPGSAVEPWLDVNPTNPQAIVAAWQQDRWDNGGARGLLAGVSEDGGSSWTQVPIDGFSRCTGGVHDRTSDPWLSFSPNGVLHSISISFGIFNSTSAVLASKSTDNGRTWSQPATLIEDTEPRYFNDKETITADPGDARFVYAIWDRFTVPEGAVQVPEHVPGFLGHTSPTWFTRSVDGGNTWEPARMIYAPGGNNETIGHQIVVLPNGTLVDVFIELFPFRGRGGFDAHFSLLRSTDRGAGWRGPAHPIADLRAIGTTDPDTGTPVRSGFGLQDVAVDRNPASPSYGTLYAVWEDGRFSGFTHNDIAFSLSRDGGETWTEPVKVNLTPASGPEGNRQAFTPSVEVAADGTVGVSYYDFRNNDMLSGTPTDYFLATCAPGSDCTDDASWSETHLGGSFNMQNAPFAGGLFLGDYQGLRALGAGFGAVFGQTDATEGTSTVYFVRATP
jgi:hypothetical protein